MNTERQKTAICDCLFAKEAIKRLVDNPELLEARCKKGGCLVTFRRAGDNSEVKDCTDGERVGIPRCSVVRIDLEETRSNYERDRRNYETDARKVSKVVERHLKKLRELKGELNEILQGPKASIDGS